MVQALVASETGKAYHSERNGVQIEALAALSMKLVHPDVFLPLFPARAVRRAIQAFQPDIVHIQDQYTLGRNAAIAAQQLEIKCVGTNHLLPENSAPYVPVLSRIKPLFNWVLWKWMRETYDRVDVVAVPSQTAVRVLRSVGIRQPVFPISCGADIALFHTDPTVDRSAWRSRYGIAPQKTIFFFVGRVDREKRWSTDSRNVLAQPG